MHDHRPTTSKRNIPNNYCEPILELYESVNFVQDVEELVSRLHEIAAPMVNADKCFLAVFDAASRKLGNIYFCGETNDNGGAVLWAADRAEFVFRTAAPLAITPEMASGLIGRGQLLEIEGAPGSMMAVPLRTKRSIVGVFGVYNDNNERQFTTAQLEVLSTVAKPAALVLERKQIEEGLRSSELQYRRLFESSPQAAFICDRQTLRFLAVNDSAIELYGYSREDFLERLTLADIRPREVVPRFLSIVAGLETAPMVRVPSTHQKKDGTLIQTEVSSQAQTYLSRSAELFLVTDVTGQVAAEKETVRLNEELVRQRAVQKVILDTVPCVIWETPTAPNLPSAPKPYVNEHITEMFGYTSEEWTSTPGFWRTAVHPDDLEQMDRKGEELFRNGEVTAVVRWISKSGDVIWGENRMITIKDDSGQVVGVRGITLDITQRKNLEEQLTHQALHDPLTLLPNRVLFRDRVKHALKRNTRRRDPVAVLFIDLDNFKSVNDTLGHGAGDELLVSVTERLNACLRPGDTPARLGGDEFAVLIEDTKHTEGAKMIAERIRTVIAEPFIIDGKAVFVSTSIGIALSVDGKETVADLLRNADLAMYKSKSTGKNRWTVYESELHDLVLRRMQIETDLRAAIDNNELEVVYQPIMELDSERIVGMEALLRWRHPKLGVIPPMDFIPVAEETGLIQPIGRWVLEEACRQAREWHELKGSDELYMSVNISERQLREGELLDDVRYALTSSGLSPQKLVLEITESSMLSNTETTIDQLNKLKALGLKLAVDDFGTGYSSLSYLQRFPMDILKIDKSFVEKLSFGREGIAVARAIISMSETLNLKTIAEGIETPSQSRELRSLGCVLGQGYHFARPLDPDAMMRFIGTAGTAETGNEVPGVGVHVRTSRAEIPRRV